MEAYGQRENLHSQSFQAAYQQLFKNHSSWRKSLKEYKKNPSKFNNKPKIPYKRKYLQPIQFKSSAIRVRDGFLLLSLSKGLEPVKVRWSLDKPNFVKIYWKPGQGWELSCVMEKEIEEQKLDKNKVMSADLGVKRVSSTFDKQDCITYSGKVLRSLVRLENKVKGKTSRKASKLKKGSRKWKKIKRAERKVKRSIKNKINDILHKISRTIVNDAASKGIGKIVIGDCSGIHTNTNCGKKNNQQIQQSPEQRLRKYIEYKFESIGGITEVISEEYTSQTCPQCGKRYKPQNRIYKCRECGFIYDRDGVGGYKYLFQKSIV